MSHNVPIVHLFCTICLQIGLKLRELASFLGLHVCQVITSKPTDSVWRHQTMHDDVIVIMYHSWEWDMINCTTVDIMLKRTKQWYNIYKTLINIKQTENIVGTLLSIHAKHNTCNSYYFISMWFETNCSIYKMDINTFSSFIHHGLVTHFKKSVANYEIVLSLISI